MVDALSQLPHFFKLQGVLNICSRLFFLLCIHIGYMRSRITFSQVPSLKITFWMFESVLFWGPIDLLFWVGHDIMSLFKFIRANYCPRWIAQRSGWWSFFCKHLFLGKFWMHVLVAHFSQKCHDVLQIFWWVWKNKKFNQYWHGKVGHHTTIKAIYKMGVGFYWSHQPHGVICKQQIYIGDN